ncbi:hypothetical protein [Hydrogenophaga sp. 5NK40-0174]|uniref:hypothetical protein n=1 Tax=Hydrogenophaga sp. 5NK40-0174 TaxID=3127649 RepID=UPI003341349F
MASIESELSAKTEATSTESFEWWQSWQRLVAKATAFFAVSAVLLYYIGRAVQIGYLAEWGIDGSVFPKTSDEIAVTGFHGLLNGIGYLFTFLLDRIIWAAVGGIAFALYVGLIWFGLSLAFSAFEAPRVDRWKWLERFHLRRPLLLATVGAGSGILAPFALAMLFGIFAAPLFVGRTVGEQLAQDHLADFSRGCEASRYQCVQLFQKDGEVNFGYIVQSSASHIAYFDVCRKFVRQVERAGVEILPGRLPGKLDNVRKFACPPTEARSGAYRVPQPDSLFGIYPLIRRDKS